MFAAEARAGAVLAGTVRLVWAMVAGTSAAIVAGTLVTGSGPHAGDEDAPRLDFDIETVARIHGVLVMSTIAMRHRAGGANLEAGSTNGRR